MPTIDVRLAAETDLDRIVGWWRELIRLHADHEPGHFRLASDGEGRFRAFVRARLGAEDALVLVASADGVPVGFANLELRQPPPVLAQEPFGYLDNLWVDPSFRRAGVATALLQRARAWLEGRGVGAWRATVYTWNAPALALCERSGLAPRALPLGGWSLGPARAPGA